MMFQTKRFGLVASKQEYMMLCRADRHMKQKERKRKRNEMASDNSYRNVHRSEISTRD